MEHEFTKEILKKLEKQFDKYSQAIFEKNPLVQYLNIKIVSATRGSKA